MKSLHCSQQLHCVRSLAAKRCFTTFNLSLLPWQRPSCPSLLSYSPRRPQAGVVHGGRGHQSAAESQAGARRVPAAAPAQLLADQRQLHPAEPAAKRQLPPLQRHGHLGLHRQRAWHLLQIGLHLILRRWESVRSLHDFLFFFLKFFLFLPALRFTGLYSF